MQAPRALRGKSAPRVPARPLREGAVSRCVRARAAVPEVAEESVVEAQKRDLQQMLNRPYKYGFQTMIESDTFPAGLNEDVVRAISAKKAEPEWMLEFRLRAFRRWLSMEEPAWSDNTYPAIDYQALSYYSEPKVKEKKQSLDEVDPELLRTFDKLGIPLNEQKRLSNVAVDAVFDSVSIATTFRADLAKAGVIFCSISEAVKEFPDLVREHLGSVVRCRSCPCSLSTSEPPRPCSPLAQVVQSARTLASAAQTTSSVTIVVTLRIVLISSSTAEVSSHHSDLHHKNDPLQVPVGDNYFTALNSAVFSDGSFVYVPEGVRCPMELSTYFRINAENTGQFERTLIIADKGSYVSYLEGCTAPQRDTHQLHAAVVEIVALEDAEVKYSTVQNWYPGDEEGRGGIYNFVTKRADCRGDRSKVMWTQVETGSAVTWKYPSCILRGDDSQGEFYSIAIANNAQQADTGTKMVHLGKRTKSRIVSKGISAGKAQNTYRGLVSMHPKAKDSRNYTQCDSLLIGGRCGAHTVPYIEVRNNSSRVEHEATTSKVDDDQLFYCRQRGMDEEEAVALVVNGFCKEVLQALPMEFAMEAQQLVAISLEGSVG